MKAIHNIFDNLSNTHNKDKTKGALLLGMLIFSAIAITGMSAFIGWALALNKVNSNIHGKEQALQIAEAGIDYYRWHLAHDPNDFQDGTGEAGPYVHDFTDRFDEVFGQFSLVITPPGDGSEIVTIESTGTLTNDPSISRTIVVELAQTSFSSWAIISNSNLYIPQNTSISGGVHSNQGVRVDGYVDNQVTSALTSYDDPLHTGDVEHAVHTHVKVPPLTGIYSDFVSNEAPPADIDERTDVFGAGREVSQAAVDFNGITQDLAEIKAAAQASGNYYPSSGRQGFHIVLKTDDTYDIYRVMSQQNLGATCADPTSPPADPDWSGWSIRTTSGEVLIGNFPIPSDGMIFAEDNIWVNGTVNGKRVTIGAGVFPDVEASRKHIIINNDLMYTNYDGIDAIGLVAQDDITIGLMSDTDLQIDAALVAQNGRVGRFTYNSGGTTCSTYRQRNSLTINGMVASNGEYTFYNPSTGAGYQTVDINYDADLGTNPPPGFPEASTEYQTVSWEESR